MTHNDNTESPPEHAHPAEQTERFEQVDMLGSATPQTGDQIDKDPSTWVSGDEPMTAAQRSYLDTLATQAGEQIPADLTKAQASEHIDRLRSEGSSS